MAGKVSERTWFPWLLGLAAAVVAIAAGQLLGSAPSPVPARASANAAAPALATASTAPSIPFELVTHCGIDEARIGETYYEADQPLVVEYGPPAGWQNPVQPGTMTLLGPSGVLFRDDAGHEVHFHARPGATAFKHLCD